MKKSDKHFTLDRKNVKFMSLQADKSENDKYWASRSVEERFFAIEFLRHQYMQMMGIKPIMDKKHFDLF